MVSYVSPSAGEVKGANAGLFLLLGELGGNPRGGEGDLASAEIAHVFHNTCAVDVVCGYRNVCIGLEHQGQWNVLWPL